MTYTKLVAIKIVQKFQRHETVVRKSPIIGAITGPRKLAAEKSANGTDRSEGSQISVRAPPEFVTVGEPKKPPKNLKTSNAPMLGANAQPI